MKKQKSKTDRFKGEVQEIEIEPFKHFALSKDERFKIEARMDELEALIENLHNTLCSLEDELIDLEKKLDTPHITVFIIDYLIWKNKPVHISEIEDAIIKSPFDHLCTKDLHWHARYDDVFISGDIYMYKDIFYLNPLLHPKWKNKIKSEMKSGLKKYYDNNYDEDGEDHSYFPF